MGLLLSTLNIHSCFCGTCVQLIFTVNTYVRNLGIVYKY